MGRRPVRKTGDGHATTIIDYQRPQRRLNNVQLLGHTLSPSHSHHRAKAAHNGSGGQIPNVSPQVVVLDINPPEKHWTGCPPPRTRSSRTDRLNRDGRDVGGQRSWPPAVTLHKRLEGLSVVKGDITEDG
ncbi:conserved hypothetical protein [Coccidioides posadasii str. Silveira]|uniref:Uncharacterized protein n=1 Tax=Coccidioides posadasii (strain RMSCC 757 / Silveira) TaxID=443226 RepID=E9D2W5_COCPS|nr:conserved hypothetical protein [Coccidioides posadasii str. Silveira]